jgi:hypothetical protein
MGSVAISAVPMREKISFTSGKSRRMTASLCFCNSSEEDKPALLLRMSWKAKSPSSSCGMNSEPRRVKTQSEEPNSTSMGSTMSGLNRRPN